MSHTHHFSAVACHCFRYFVSTKDVDCTIILKLQNYVLIPRWSVLEKRTVSRLIKKFLYECSAFLRCVHRLVIQENTRLRKLAVSVKDLEAPALLGSSGVNHKHWRIVTEVGCFWADASHPLQTMGEAQKLSNPNRYTPSSERFEIEDVCCLHCRVHMSLSTPGSCVKSCSLMAISCCASPDLHVGGPPLAVYMLPITVLPATIHELTFNSWEYYLS
jgi:hypothetical protein